jgi:mono/diheme cytochrome c family protein
MKGNIGLVSKMKPAIIGLIGIKIGAIFLLFAFSPIQLNKEWIAPPGYINKANPVASNAQSITDGKIMYVKNCFDCHGSKGKGDGPKSADLEKSPGNFTKEDFQKQTDGSIFWKISEGRKPMPSFKKDLTENERWAVINYVRTLGLKKKNAYNGLIDRTRKLIFRKTMKK